jgi:hypothetical protein
MTSHYAVIKRDPERLLKEKERVKTIMNERYKNDEEYRLRRIEYARLRRLKLKEELENNNTTTSCA